MKSLILNQINYSKFKGTNYQIIPLNLQHILFFKENELIASGNAATNIIHYYGRNNTHFSKFPLIKGYEIEFRTPDLCLYHWDHSSGKYIPVGSRIGSPLIRNKLFDQIRRGEFDEEYLTEEEEKEFKRLEEAGYIEQIDSTTWRVTDSGWDAMDELVCELKSNI